MNQACAIDFTPPIRSGAGSGVKDDGTVDACLVQRSYLRAGPPPGRRRATTLSGLAGCRVLTFQLFDAMIAVGKAPVAA